jgi:hypothetical protein
MFRPLSDREEYVAEKIVDAAYRVHKALGPGLLERVYRDGIKRIILWALRLRVFVAERLRF